MIHSQKRRDIPVGLRIIGTIKLVIAFILIGFSFGFFQLLHTDPAASAQHLAALLHLNPEKHWVMWLMSLAEDTASSQLRVIAAGTSFYAVLYIIEGWGLLKGKHWAEYMVLIITASFLPLEIYEVDMKASMVRISVLAVNAVIAAYLVRRIYRDRLHLP